MPVAISAKVEGIESVQRALRDLDNKIRNKINRKAMTKASQPMAKAVKQGAPVDTSEHNIASGLLKKSIGRKIKTYRGSGVVVVIIGPRVGFRMQVGVRSKGKKRGQPFYQDPANIAHLVEHGTNRAKKHPFMRPAYDLTKKQTSDIYKQTVLEELGK